VSCNCIIHIVDSAVCLVGDAPKLLSGVTDVTVISPEVATLECSVKPGTKDVEIRWYELLLFLITGDNLFLKHYLHF